MTSLKTWVFTAAACCSFAAGASGECVGKGVELQVLGSGGPEMEDKRTSSSYLIRTDGRARVLVDAGGGSALRFGEAGAHVADLDIVLLSHLHVDHTSDLPALIKSSYFEHRSRPLPIYGPAGNGSFPSTTKFASALFDARTGIYRYLGRFLDGAENGYRLQAYDVPSRPAEPRRIFSQGGLLVSAIPTVHGNVPALAWRVEIDGRAIAFSGDSDGSHLDRIAKDADLLVAHNAIPEDAPPGIHSLHMPPSVIGAIAETSAVKQLVLSHRMLRSLGHEKQTAAVIAEKYAGPVSFADDLSCYRLTPSPGPPRL